jgi:hypothetical protein
MDVVKVTKGLIAFTPEIDGNGLTTYHVCSIPHSYVILVKRGRLEGMSNMPVLPIRGYSVSGMYVCVNITQKFSCECRWYKG